jgi:ATP-dependent Clp protease adaptor protein ClpS
MLSSRILSSGAMARPSPRRSILPLAPQYTGEWTDAGDDGDHKDNRREGPGQVGLATRTRAKSKKPSQFKVLMLNDDYTPMEFVVMVLKRFFNMDLEQATRVMLHVHQRGVGVCGVFPYEIAETKVNQVMDFARENQHPLQCTLEKA